MKEISAELLDRNCTICLNCGAIHEGAKSIRDTCLECGVSEDTYWITPSHGWLNLKGGKQ